eukprot:scaffold1617_cov252-Pinguiococcus_pyrenoidosus.AAC.8
MWKALTDILDDGLDGQVWADEGAANKSSQLKDYDRNQADTPSKASGDGASPTRAVGPNDTADTFRIQKKLADVDQDWEKIWEEVKSPSGKAAPPKEHPPKEAAAPDSQSPWGSFFSAAGLSSLAGADTSKPEQAPEASTSAPASAAATQSTTPVPEALKTIGSWFTVEPTQRKADAEDADDAPQQGAAAEADEQESEAEPHQPAASADASSSPSSPAPADAQQAITPASVSGAPASLTTGLEELEALEASLGSLDIQEHSGGTPADLISADGLDFDLDAFAEDLNLTASVEDTSRES